MLTEMQFHCRLGDTDVLTCTAKRGGTQYAFMCRGHRVVMFRLRYRHLGRWSGWYEPKSIRRNPEWCEAVQLGVNMFRIDQIANAA